MSLAEVLKLVHIVAVIVWVGGSFMLIVLFELTRRSSDEAAVLGLSRVGESVGKFVFNPAGILALGAGIWLVIEADFEFSEAWISIGFLGVILSAKGPVFSAGVVGGVRVGQHAADGPGRLSSYVLVAAGHGLY